MEIVHGIGELLQTLGFFGGIGLIILAANKAKLDRMKAERQMWQQTNGAQNSGQNSGQNGDVIAELRALKQQMAEMHSTSHEFDISFDEALNRMGERVSRVETKVASMPSSSSQPEQYQRTGQG